MNSIEEMKRKAKLVELGIGALVHSWKEGGLSEVDAAAALVAFSSTFVAEVGIPFSDAISLFTKGYQTVAVTRNQNIVKH